MSRPLPIRQTHLFYRNTVGGVNAQRMLFHAYIIINVARIVRECVPLYYI